MSDGIGHGVVLGGIGGDSHSVGLTILRQGLAMKGYRVCYLGIHNRLEDFFSMAAFSNVVMISCMDGHASYYLREFPEFMKQYKAHRQIWYLGGNLHIGDGSGYERKFGEMGFSRVFVKFVDIGTLLSLLDRDLYGVDPVMNCPTLWERSAQVSGRLSASVTDEKLDPVYYEQTRRDVLQHWKTGHAARDIEANASFLISQPSFSEFQAKVNSQRMPMLFQPRSGVALVDEQIKLFKAFKSAGARVLSYQVDSLTRNNAYTTAEEAIIDSKASAKSTINGFPIVNHGVPLLRRVIQEVCAPLQTRHSTRDARLLAEISYAGGVTSFEGGAICYNIPYYKDYPLDQSIRRWQYIDRLTGLYYDRFGIVLDREFFGTLTATLIPPSLAIVSNIIESVLAARQGVKCLSLGYAEQGNRVQDIAAIRTLRPMTSEVLHNLGYKNIQINTVFHQYMAGFPESYERASDLIFNSSITAALSGATRLILKTPVEALRIASMEDNISGINLVKRGISAAAFEELSKDRIDQECDIIRREVQSILESLIYCGQGDIAQGVVSGFEKGFIDIPFSPSLFNRGEVVTARDNQGAVRFLSIGNLQFDRELRDFHQDKMAERRRAEGLYSQKQDYLLVERDVLQIARGQYQQWPLSR
ncbi:MAG: methylaspartate mutase subunit E [Blastocatellia bacterium]